jgi:hypothetical protein
MVRMGHIHYACVTANSSFSALHLELNPGEKTALIERRFGKG